MNRVPLSMSFTSLDLSLTGTVRTRTPSGFAAERGTLSRTRSEREPSGERTTAPVSVSPPSRSVAVSPLRNTVRSCARAFSAAARVL